MHRKKVKKRISEYAKVNGTENISQIQEQKEVYKVYKAMGGKEGKLLRY